MTYTANEKDIVTLVGFEKKAKQISEKRTVHCTDRYVLAAFLVVKTVDLQRKNVSRKILASLYEWLRQNGKIRRIRFF